MVRVELMRLFCRALKLVSRNEAVLLSEWSNIAEVDAVKEGKKKEEEAKDMRKGLLSCESCARTAPARNVE